MGEEIDDKRRLDFIEKAGCDWDGFSATFIGDETYFGSSLRECIDQAMSDRDSE
ncbi:hypothetical protein [Modicisalibacter coralii]|uniref:hypothetical protein n=1 Tax=Modicisalibacter coralii TaxID=2304602 RepID=UPI0013967E1E|nr:hypothetical protein [Halomonas coralii]